MQEEWSEDLVFSNIYLPDEDQTDDEDDEDYEDDEDEYDDEASFDGEDLETTEAES